MSRSTSRLAIAFAALILAMPAAGYEGIGRSATPAELQAWDIDVRPDFTGLPRGSGSVARGEAIWETQCASCHGIFGESNEVFTPLAGGTTRDDQNSGHVKALTGNTTPHRTTLMKVPTVSTLFDYIRRAMPWNAPKSLSSDDVYAVTAYLLNLNDIVPADFVLDQDSIRDVQNRMPNRNGMTMDHGMWSVRGKPDTASRACMQNCRGDVHVTSRLPDYARNAHGNLHDQNRTFGAVRGVVTGPAEVAAAAASAPSAAHTVAEESGCLACHGIDEKIAGPALRDVARRYAGKPDMAGKLADKVLRGGGGVWGDMAMPAQEQVTPQQARQLVDWVLAGAK